MKNIPSCSDKILSLHWVHMNSSYFAQRWFDKFLTRRSRSPLLSTSDILPSQWPTIKVEASSVKKSRRKSCLFHLYIPKDIRNNQLKYVLLLKKPMHKFFVKKVIQHFTPNTSFILPSSPQEAQDKWPSSLQRWNRKHWLIDSKTCLQSNSPSTHAGATSQTS